MDLPWVRADIGTWRNQMAIDVFTKDLNRERCFQNPNRQKCKFGNAATVRPERMCATASASMQDDRLTSLDDLSDAGGKPFPSTNQTHGACSGLARARSPGVAGATNRKQPR